MGEPLFGDIDDVLPQEPNGEVVHWMDARPLTVGAAGLGITIAAAVAIGALATVACMTLLNRRAVRREWNGREDWA